MSVHKVSRSRRVRAAQESRIRDRDRGVTKGDMIQFGAMMREERRDRKASRKKSAKQVGSDAERAGRELAARPQRPLTERQQMLLGLLTDTPQRPVDLREPMGGLTQGQLGSVMSSLCARGLARKVPDKGWRLEP